jgi:hypothetical protein
VKRLGPELKMPKLNGGGMKVPPFLTDLYFDLRERRLLPLVALLLVGIVAAPILLNGGSSEPEPVPSSPIAAGSAPTASRSLTVVRAEPGLRNYKKRLSHRSPSNPFKQRFTGPDLKGSELNEQTSTSTTSTSTETATGETPVAAPPSSPGGSSPSGGGGTNDQPPPGGLIYYAFAADIQITRTETKKDGSKETGDPVVHKGVLPATVLPGEKAQVVTYMGISPKTRKPLFLVSTDVTGVFGEGKCVSGAGSCQLIELEPKFPETFFYGENDVRYKINVLSVEPVVTGHS